MCSICIHTGIVIVGEEAVCHFDLGIFVASIVPNGPADRDGRIRPGMVSWRLGQLWIGCFILFYLVRDVNRGLKGLYGHKLIRGPPEAIAHLLFGRQQYSTATFVCRWSSDFPEQHQPGRRHLQRGSGGHTEQPQGGAAHHLPAKRCPVCVPSCGLIVDSVIKLVNRKHACILLENSDVYEWHEFLSLSASVLLSPLSLRSSSIRNCEAPTTLMADKQLADESLDEIASVTTKTCNRLHIPPEVLGTQVRPH